MNELRSALNEFDSVSLNEIAEVNLMNRIDQKYWFHISLLNELLKRIKAHYNILEINGHRLMEYRTTYFDTSDNGMYLTHHNQKLNRYKIRRRNYVTSATSFFEVKLKNNKGRTIKERVESTCVMDGIFIPEFDHLTIKTPFRKKLLWPVLNNRFYRLSFIHKDKKDRCTIDIQLAFWNDSGEILLDDLVVFELKRGQSLKSSPMVKLLRDMKIRQRGLSKYCTGRALLEPWLKQNAFKPRLRYLEKVVHYSIARSQ